jgi:hypothetical protein
MSMTTDVVTKCRLVGQFTDEGQVPPGLAPAAGESVRTSAVYTFAEHGSTQSATQPFTVLLAGGEVATVRGHALKVLEPAHAGGSSHYAIVERRAGEEVIVGLFGTAHVRGVFSGEARTERNGA